jgi:hypothetical protein
VKNSAALLIILMTSCGFGGSSPAGTHERVDPGPGPGSWEMQPPADTIRIPFEVVDGELRVHARMNGQDVRMLIDNGSLWDQLLFFGSERVDALGMVADGVAEVGGAGSGDEVHADMVSNVAIGLDGLDGHYLEFRSQAAIIMPYERGESNPWSVAEGQFSAQFFKHFVVHFDFDEGLMTLTRPDVFTPPVGARELVIRPGPGVGSWTIPAVVTLHDGRRLELQVTMDLGWDEAMSVTTGEKNDVSAPAGLEKALLGYGAKGPIRGYLGTMPIVELAGWRLEDVETTYASREDGGAGADEFLIGLGALQRFNLTFDYPGNRLYLEARMPAATTSTSIRSGPE